MSQPITENEYNQKIQNEADNLQVALENAADPDTTAVELVEDAVDVRSFLRELWGSGYGAIISDFTQYNADVERFFDPEVALDADSFESALKKMTYYQILADVLVAHERN